MNKTLITTMVLAIGLLAVTANAAIISVSGPLSSADTPPAIIPAPENLLNSVAFNSGMQGFDEAQGVLTTVPHATDSGVIPAGSWVNSHMIFLNQEDGIDDTISHTDVVWTFDGPVVGVMFDFRGELEAASTFELGAPGTNYLSESEWEAAPYDGRGTEGDLCPVVGNTITVSMWAVQPGDWMRVVTLAPIEANIDIKPKTLNLKSKAPLTAFINLPEGYDEEDINISTVECEGAPAVSSVMAGDDKLFVRFDSQALVGVTAGDAVELTVKGELTNGIHFVGSDTIKVKDKED